MLNFTLGIFKFLIIFYILLNVITFFILIVLFIFMYLNLILVLISSDIKLILFFTSTLNATFILQGGIYVRTSDTAYLVLFYFLLTWSIILCIFGNVTLILLILKLILILFWFGFPICSASLLKIIISILLNNSTSLLYLINFLIIYYSSISILFRSFIEIQQHIQFNLFIFYFLLFSVSTLFYFMI